MLLQKLWVKTLETLAHWIDVAYGQVMIFLIVLVIGVLGIIIFTIGNGWANLLNALNVIPNAHVSDTRTIVNGIKPMGQLVTVSYKLASADTRVDIRDGRLEVCNQSAKFAYVVEVQAGTDLSNITPADISFDEVSQTYTIKLPPPQLTSCNVYDNYSRYEYFLPGRTCKYYEEDFSALGEYQVIEVTRDKALTDEILEDAKRENEQTLDGFFTAIAGKDVTVIYNDIEPQNDSSCYPQEPTGWVHNTQENGVVYWTRK